MWFDKPKIRMISILCILCILNLSACYKRDLLPEDQSIPVIEKVFFLHTKIGILNLQHTEVNDNQLHGLISTTIPEHKRKDEIHIYIESMEIISEQRVSIDLGEIEKIEVIKLNKQQIPGIIGLVLGAALAVGIIILALIPGPKEGVPPLNWL